MFKQSADQFEINPPKMFIVLFPSILLQFSNIAVAENLHMPRSSTPALQKVQINRERKVSSTAELRLTDTRRSVQGKFGWKLAPGHKMHLVGRTSSKYSTDTAASMVGLGYNWRIARRYTLDLNTMNIEASTGRTRTDYGIGLRYRMPTRKFKSTIRIGYRSAEDISSLTDVNFSVSKNALNIGDSKLGLSGSTRWRQKEFSSGSIVEGLGGAVGVNLQLKSKFGLNLRHNIRDDISPEKTSLAGTFTSGSGGKSVMVRFGIDSTDTASLMLRTSLN